MQSIQLNSIDHPHLEATTTSSSTSRSQTTTAATTTRRTTSSTTLKQKAATTATTTFIPKFHPSVNQHRPSLHAADHRALHLLLLPQGALPLVHLASSPRLAIQFPRATTSRRNLDRACGPAAGDLRDAPDIITLSSEEDFCQRVGHSVSSCFPEQRI